ncbi:hypothetical protein [Roseateles sp. BYS96W]|uniref:Lipoprotein n=1 Tax=Pelomonas nitida TaxID=3299027 RepID=A0ABW7G9Z1_9BURK
MKRLALVAALLSATLLSGCIVVPSHRYYHHHDEGRGDYRGGYGQPGRR